MSTTPRHAARFALFLGESGRLESREPGGPARRGQISGFCIFLLTLKLLYTLW